MKIKVFNTVLLIMAGFSNLFGQPVSEFSWANRHHYANYTTSPKNQIADGACGIFAGVALIESMYNLYYNNYKDVNFDLSESQAYSTCNSYGPVGSAGIESTLQFAKYVGIASEVCFKYPTQEPFYKTNLNCSYQCNTKVIIPDYHQLTFGNSITTADIKCIDSIKTKLIRYGPIAVFDHVYPKHNDAAHAVLLIGWRTTNNITEWQFLDSGGNLQSDQRNYYFDYDIYNRGLSSTNGSDFRAFILYPKANGTIIRNAILPPMQPQWLDKDMDNYYNWGIGPKPSGCPGYDKPDGDDGDCLKGPMDKYGNLSSITPFVTISVNGNPAGLCPNTDYPITIYAACADLYEVQVIGDATKYGSGASGSCYIHTSGTFGRVEIRARGHNGNGWSAFKSAFYYRKSYCPASLKSTIIEDTASMVNKAKELNSELAVYPIPVKDVLFIQPDETGIIQKVILYNQLGSQVRTMKATNVAGILEMNVSDLPDGCYFLRVVFKEKIIDKKIIIANQ